jgi:hypothetical protein
VHAGTVPVTGDGLTVPLNVDFELFTKAQKKETSNPDVISGFLGTLGKYLEFPLAFGDLGVDALVVDARVEAEIKVGVSDFTSDTANVGKANSAVVFTLWSGVSTFGEAERHTLLHQEILLLKSKPSVRIIRDGGASVRGVWRAVRQHHFTHNENAVLTGAVRIEGDRFEHAIRVTTFSLLGRGAIKAPIGKLIKSRELIKVPEHALGAEILNR